MTSGAKGVARVLEDKVAVVTGAGRGIGAAIARGYAAAGARVCCAARTRSEIEATARMIADAGGQALAVPLDVTDAHSVEAALGTVAERWGGLDLVVINAGAGGGRKRVEECDPATDWQRILDVNLTGAFHCARLAAPHLRRRGGGKIIMLGSGMGHSSLHGTAAYSCSKAALWMLARILADELRGDGIAVNELVPGPVRTTMTAASAGQPGSVLNLSEEWIKAPEDVVSMALFIASLPDRGPTGQSFSLMRRTF